MCKISTLWFADALPCLILQSVQTQPTLVILVPCTHICLATNSRLAVRTVGTKLATGAVGSPRSMPLVRRRCSGVLMCGSQVVEGEGPLVRVQKRTPIFRVQKKSKRGHPSSSPEPKEEPE